jgi:integrase
MSKPSLPRLRQKGHAYYFDTQRTPRYWIPLGSDRVAALRQYERLMASQGAPGTVTRMVTEYLDHLAAGGRGAFGRPVRAPTLGQYRAFAKHLTSVFDDVRPEEVTQADVAKYLRDCKRTSARGEISLLSSAYQHALAEQQITFNPCIGVRSPVPRAKRDRYITDDELAAVREKALPVLQIAMDLAHLTGLRVSDLLSARWDQFGDGYLENAKTGVRQRFVLTDDLRDVLAAARALQGRVVSLYVLARHGRPLNRHTVGTWWRAACAAAGVTDAHWHDIRAKAGTDAEADGADPQKLLGRSSAQTTRTYLRGKRIHTVDPVRRKRG